MGGVPRRLAGFLELLEAVPDRADRIQLLIDVADRFREVPPEIAERPFPESRRVPHCESEAFVWAVPRPDGTLDFHFAVENPQGISARAMAVILDETLSGAPLEEVAWVPGDLPLEIFGNELSMGKSMGLMGMVGMVLAAARSRAGVAARTG
ncbi:MAG: SufE family protein [Thermoanaerobaculia bacterium]|nr:SufE family protein [Thermoanaerobaculia bacterium]